MITSCESKNFVSSRIERTASFVVNAPIEEAFPLFGPVKEKLWAEGWDPEIIYSATNDVEEHMIFQTQSSHNNSEKFIWVITQYKPDDFFIEYTVSTSERIWFITVQCEVKGLKTKVGVTYSYTALTEIGIKKNEEALKKMFEHNLQDWEEAIDYYLQTGNQKAQ